MKHEAHQAIRDAIESGYGGLTGDEYLVAKIIRGQGRMPIHRLKSVMAAVVMVLVLTGVAFALTPRKYAVLDSGTWTYVDNQILYQGAEDKRPTVVLEKEGIRTNLTLVFSPSQAILAGRAGCLFVSPFIGWKEDNGEDCRQYMQDIVTIYKNYGWYGKTQIIAAAVRSPKQIVDCAVSGVDIVTAGLPVFQAAVNHAYTRQGMDTFTDAWDHTAQE